LEGLDMIFGRLRIFGERRGMRGKGKNNGKDVIRGSLHCAVHDETVNYFGRDDGYLWLGWGERATAKATTVAGQFARFITASN
jgi:hypothetical protein